MMNTLIIIAGLLSVQPATIQLDNELFDLHSMREQVRTYIIEDVAKVNHVIFSALRDGMSVGSKLIDQQSDTPSLLAQKKDAADSAKQSHARVN